MYNCCPKGSSLFHISNFEKFKYFSPKSPFKPVLGTHGPHHLTTAPQSISTLLVRAAASGERTDP